MADIFPFRALRPIPAEAAVFSASAYDSEQREGQKVWKSTEPSYLKILLPQIFSEQKLSKEECFDISRHNLEKYMADGVLQKDEKSSFYIYRQINGNNSFTTLIALASIEEYLEGRIKRHELTRSDKEEKIRNYFKEVGINGSAVLLTYPSIIELNAIIDTVLVAPAPAYDFRDESGIQHQVWVVNSEKDILSIQDFFKNVPALYIADGHHRCASFALDYPEVRNFMACLIPDSDILIHAFHRYLKDFGMPVSEFISKLSEKFEISEVNTNQIQSAPGIIYFYTAGKWFRIQIPESLQHSGNLCENLDVYILDKYIFGDILNIVNSRISNRIDFVPGLASLESLTFQVDQLFEEALFLLHPVDSGVVMQVSDHNETMPPKSTWIEPKLRSGLLIHELKK